MSSLRYFETLVPQLKSWVLAHPKTPWIFLEGDLGAGKTTLTKELLEALGFDFAEVQSPTFLKVISYKNSKGEVALHMDAYRIEEETEFLRLGLEDYESLRVGIVEWPDSFEKFLTQYPAFKESLDVGAVMKVSLPSQIIKLL